MLGEIYLVRDRLTSEIRQADDATAARAGALLRAGKLPAGHEDRPDESQLQGGWQRRGKNIMTPRERAALPVTGTIDH